MNIGKNAERELVLILREQDFNAGRIPTFNSSFLGERLVLLSLS